MFVAPAATATPYRSASPAVTPAVRDDGSRRAAGAALSNLVANAVKHGTPGKPVDVRVTSDDAHAIVEVHNEGAIPMQIMPNLFQPFAVRAGHRREGLGLDPFIAKAIALAHRGDLHVASTKASGRTFCLVPPRAA